MNRVSPSRGQAFGLGAFVGSALGAAATWLVTRGPVPIIDDGSAIFAASDAKAHRDLVEVLQGVGLRPQRQRHTSAVRRVIYHGGGLIINWTAPEVHQRMGKPACGLGIVSRYPLQTAESIATALRAKGHEARVVTDFEPEAPRGSLVAVHTDALLNGAIIVRRHLLRMGKPPERYQPE